jgi:uncharacterized protein (DUF433 family)/DNA-binding transcriptional MerR regulator
MDSQAKDELMSVLEEPRLGDGVYTFPEAAEILRGIDRPVTVRQLRYWMGTGLTPATHETEEGVPVLSFDDLISLEIVRRFRHEGVSLQHVRVVEAELRRQLKLARPFAYRVFFTDGANVWAEIIGESGPISIELVGKRRGHYVWTDAIRTFADDIRFSEGPQPHAASWTLSPWVEINPAIQFGAPVIAGSRVPLRTIAANLEVGTPAQVAEWYGLRVEQVKGAKDYLAVH